MTKCFCAAEVSAARQLCPNRLPPVASDELLDMELQHLAVWTFFAALGLLDGESLEIIFQGAILNPLYFGEDRPRLSQAGVKARYELLLQLCLP